MTTSTRSAGGILLAAAFLVAAEGGLAIAAENESIVHRQQGGIARQANLTSPPMYYRPEKANVHDAWYFLVDDKTHCIHMQRTDPEHPEDAREYCSLGHAVSGDLIAWRTMPTVLRGGHRDACDSGRVHTGCVVTHEGLHYMFYTATRGDGKGINRIALATSSDGLQWAKHPQSPVINPDPRWYCNEDHRPRPTNHSPSWVDCRDPLVVPDPDGDGYWCFYVARRPADTNAESAVIALCHSYDLVHWKHRPPCFAPRRYACIEVPDVFFLDGKWYMTVMTGNGYGQRNVLSDPLLSQATVYAVADRLQGPYREPPDNILMGSTANNGYCCRSILKDGQRCLLNPQRGQLSIPKVLRADREGRLLVCYHPRLDAYRGETILGTVAAPALPNDGTWGNIGRWRIENQTVVGTCREDWAMHVFDRRGSDLFYEADVCVRDARAAGLAFRIQGENVRAGAYVFILDAQVGEAILTRTLDFAALDRRRFRVEPGRTYRLKCLASGPFINLFVDDLLVLQTHDEKFASGRVGLFVEKGTATFASVKADSMAHPEVQDPQATR